MAPTPIPSTAVGSPTPTSRGVFRHLGRAIGASNREADDLRAALLARIVGEDRSGSDAALVEELQDLDRYDPPGFLGAEARLAVWFRHAADGDADGAAAHATAWGATGAVDAESIAWIVRRLLGPTAD